MILPLATLVCEVDIMIIFCWSAIADSSRVIAILVASWATTIAILESTVVAVSTIIMAVVVVAAIRTRPLIASIAP